MSDDFFTDLDNTKPFLKMGFHGMAGTGKTRTSAEVAAGLHKRIGSTKPIVVFDTEKAAVFLRKFFAERGIKVAHKESRTLADLAETMRRCRDGAADILIIDSITHVWETFLADYARDKHRKRLQFEDWGVIKPMWKEKFSDPFVRDKYHAIMCGRSGFQYEDELVDDPNRPGKLKREIFKSGVKMKVEGETPYEPDVLVYMERFEDVLGEKKRVWREATVLKDRSDQIDGRTFQDPTYADFAPAVDFLLDNPIDREVSAETPNQFDDDETRRYRLTQRRDVALETVEAVMIEKGLAGQSSDAKRGKVAALQHAFGTASWTAIKDMHPDRIEAGLQRLRDHLAQARAEGATG